MTFEVETLQKELYNLVSDPNSLEQFIAGEKLGLNLTMINVERDCLIQLKKNVAKTRTLNVSIFVYHRAHWAMDSVYHELIKAGFNVQIILFPPYELSEDQTKKEHEINFKFFKDSGYNVIKGYDYKNKKFYDIEKNMPDIIFYQTQWMVFFPEQFQAENLYNKALCIGVPYGPYVAKIQQHQFNEKFHNLVWFICSENIVARQMAEKYADNNGCNTVLTGYPKMDQLYSPKVIQNHWKTQDKKRIIWAPHYSINTYCDIDFANFHIYYQRFLDFVKQKQDIEMIFKPHPLLKNRCIETEIMTEIEYDKYVKTWNNLPNGSAVMNGNYIDLFKTSDAMILDSLGFISEYLYTKKPICFINKFLNKQELLTHFNEFGQMAIQQCYIAQSWKGTEEFINEVVIGGNDYMKPQREEFYDKYLKLNEGCAGKAIVDYIKTQLGIE